MAGFIAWCTWVWFQGKLSPILFIIASLMWLALAILILRDTVKRRVALICLTIAWFIWAALQPEPRLALGQMILAGLIWLALGMSRFGRLTR